MEHRLPGLPKQALKNLIITPPPPPLASPSSPRLTPSLPRHRLPPPSPTPRASLATSSRIPLHSPTPGPPYQAHLPYPTIPRPRPNGPSPTPLARPDRPFARFPCASPHMPGNPPFPFIASNLRIIFFPPPPFIIFIIFCIC